MSAEQLRSHPEEIYRRLPEPGTADMRAARLALDNELGLKPVPGNETVCLRTLGRALIEAADREGYEPEPPRPYRELREHVGQMTREFPWLTTIFKMHPPRHGRETDQLGIWARSHVFEDYYGLLGMSEAEGKVLRNEILRAEQVTPLPEQKRQIALVPSLAA